MIKASLPVCGWRRIMISSENGQQNQNDDDEGMAWFGRICNLDFLEIVLVTYTNISVILFILVYMYHSTHQK